MTIYDGYTFEVQVVHPSGLLKYEGGHATTSRTFLVSCQHAEELGVRLLGKFYSSTDMVDYATPFLPAPFPADVSAYNLGYGLLSMVATGFFIEPLCPGCFNKENIREGYPEQGLITDPTSLAQMEKYWFEGEDAIADECNCLLTITYEENPCDCALWDAATGEWTTHAEILPKTCISVERNPSYELFTLPNANLAWSDGSQLKADSYAYMITPKADIIVHWHNVPVSRLCAIESHLVDFRGKVNDLEWGDVLSCDPVVVDPEEDYGVCLLYEPETILFIDWQEDRSKRTDAFGDSAAFGNMNTTTLKLVFKQKRVFDSNYQNDIFGWNHLFRDNETGPNVWDRVNVQSTGNPVFELKSFSNIMYPPI